MAAQHPPSSNPAPRGEFLASPLLLAAGFRHAFFTRRGGVSADPYRSLNFSVSVGDSEQNVHDNLERAAEVLEVSSDRIFCLSQVHGAVAIALFGGETRADVLSRSGDALVSGATDLACAVRTADCVPVLIADRRGGAAAAVHAGWRGIVAGVVPSAVEKLRDSASDRPELIAAIGPHISRGAFEVSADVASEICAACGDDSVADHTRGYKPYVDLCRAVRLQLMRLGFMDGDIEDVEGCTLSDPARFFSFRRDGRRSGRHLSAIVPRRP